MLKLCKHLHSNKGDANVSKLIWIVIAFVVGASLLFVLSTAFNSENDGVIGTWLNDSIEEWFGDAELRDGSSGGSISGPSNPNPNPTPNPDPSEPPVPEGIEHSGTIPAGGTYYQFNESSEIGVYEGENLVTLSEGDNFPDSVSVGDVYVYEDYEYRYNMLWDGEFWINITDMIGDEEAFVDYGICEGWYVQILNRGKEAYSDMLSMINNEPVTVAYGTFFDCPNLKEPPVLSQNLISMSHTFFYNEMGVSKLTIAPAIPKSVQVMTYCFANCDSLKIAPVLPDNLIYAESLFADCTNLSGYHGNENANGDFSEYVLPSSLLNMNGIFDWCELLTDAPVIPENVTDISFAFRDCELLKEAPTIPDSVIYMEETFANCDSLLSAPIIPINVANLKGAFRRCNNLQGIVIIKSSNVKTTGSLFLETNNQITVKVPAGSTTYTTLINSIPPANVTIETF